MHLRRGIIIADNGQTTGHGLEYHVAKGLRLTGKDKHIGRGIVTGQVLTMLETTINDLRMLLRQTVI